MRSQTIGAALTAGCAVLTISISGATAWGQSQRPQDRRALSEATAAENRGSKVLMRSPYQAELVREVSRDGRIFFEICRYQTAKPVTILYESCRPMGNTYIGILPEHLPELYAEVTVALNDRTTGIDPLMSENMIDGFLYSGATLLIPAAFAVNQKYGRPLSPLTLRIAALTPVAGMFYSLWKFREYRRLGDEANSLRAIIQHFSPIELSDQELDRSEGAMWDTFKRILRETSRQFVDKRYQS